MHYRQNIFVVHFKLFYIILEVCRGPWLRNTEVKHATQILHISYKFPLHTPSYVPPKSKYFFKGQVMKLSLL